ncbi:MAG: GNAT family N-acetyltransferase [Acidobacteriota bacterium]|nr:GNAT family N-acetyltransferase [Acidobacteriota bacterium]
MRIEPVILEGNAVKIAPLESDYLEDLWKAAADESLWLWTANIIKLKENLRGYIETALDEFGRKVSLSFVTIEKTSNKIVGSTRFGNKDVKNCRAEIGWT